MSDFDYYSSAPSLADMSKWIVFLRAYALVRTPACIYSVVGTPSSSRIYRKVRSVPIPDYVSNFLVDEIILFERHKSAQSCIPFDHRDLSAREAASLERLSVSPTPDSMFKPRRCDGYYVSRTSVLCLGADLVRRASRYVLGPSATEADDGELARLVAERYNGLARRASPMPAPLWPDEMRWVMRTVAGSVWAPAIEV